MRVYLLTLIAACHINLSKLQSAPIPETPWRYAFHVDMEFESLDDFYHAIEKIKEASDHLRGTLKESLKDELTGAIREDDQAVIKFHGMYQQDDRDRREERAEKKLERLYSFFSAGSIK